MTEHPFRLFDLPLWLFRGKVALKSRLARSGTLDASALPFNLELLDWLREQKAQGRSIVLATGSHRILADQVAQHLCLFDRVLATEGGINLKSDAKRDALVSLYGERGFDYVGNDWPDMNVWKSAAQAHVVSNSQRLIGKNRSNGNLGLTMGDGKPALAVSLLKAMRPHQWIKNLLVFIPLLAAHRYADGVAVLQSLLAFIAFGLAASGAYLLNDLVDVGDDRRHERKRLRPFAAGDLGLLHGWLAWPLLLVSALTLAAWALPWPFTVSLALYVAMTCAYSFKLKQLPIVDVVTLAGLYTLRIIAGAAAIMVPLSFWLLSFSMFLFLSLALIKRYSELVGAREAEGADDQSMPLRGRGYGPQDLQLVSSLGGSAGYIAVLVLALYIQDGHTASLYAEPRFIWLACPLLLYWISRAWLIAHRGHMHDDPIVFAIKDRASWAVLALCALVFMLARAGL